MSPNRVHQRISQTPSVIATDNRGRGFLRFGAIVILCVLSVLSGASANAAGNLQLGTATGGLALTPVGGNYTAAFGTMNALGVGTPTAGLTAAPLTNGALYYTQYQLSVSGGIPGTDSAYVTASVTANFLHSAALVVETCPSTSSCTTSGNFSAMSTNFASPTTVVPKPGMPKNTPVTAGIAIFLPDNDGASAYTGSLDLAVITFNAYKNSDNSLVDTTTLTLNSITVQDAVQLQLGSVSPGLITAGSDYSLNFGNVNALGIGPASGLTTSPHAGGIIYSAAYNLLPAFTDFSSTTASINVCVSKTFTHLALLALDDSSTGSSGSFSSISTTCTGATSLTTAAADRSTITRYLGLFVSNVNGATAFNGTDNATLTYTLTVP